MRALRLANHPVNLALRFMLELGALGAMAYWGWTAHEGISQLAWAAGLPLVAVVLWGTFRVPDDPGKAPVPVPGAVRLLLEVAFFATAVWSLAATRPLAALIFGGLIALHYLASIDQLEWLLSRR